MRWSRVAAICQNAIPDSPAFRESFAVPRGFDRRVWYPQHMSVQLQKMEGKLRSVDMIIEVHDARIPITGRSSQLRSLFAVRPHILVLNKMDLIDRRYRQPVEDYYAEKGVKILWTDCKRRLSRALTSLQSAMLELLRSEPRFNRAVMVVGIPNVGKSSLVNSLRLTNLGPHKLAVTEGARPGVTVRVQNRVRILDKPPLYVVDTPGVLAPGHASIDDTMKLALCDLILESATSIHHIADYLLFWMNRTGEERWKKQLGIDEAFQSDDINVVLRTICQSQDLRTKMFIPGRGHEERWDMEAAAKRLIDLFRSHKLTDHCLDKEKLLPYMS